jgi:peptidase C39-like protein
MPCLGALVAAILAHSSGNPEGSGRADVGLEELLAAIAAREASLGTVFVPFTIDAVPPKSARYRQEFGWWSARPGELAYGICTVHGYDEPQYSWLTWDGLRCSEQRSGGRSIVPYIESPATAAVVCAESMASLTVTSLPRASLFERAHLPTAFGLGICQTPWSQVLAKGRSLALSGVEEVLGRRCLRLTFDMAPVPSEDGSYTRPWILWIDAEQSLLVIRAQSLYPPAALEAYNKGQIAPELVHVLGGKDWAVFQQWDSTDLVEIAPGRWLPSHGRLSHPACPGLISYEYSAEVPGLLVGEAAPSDVFEMEPSGWCRVDDQVAGIQEVASPGRAPIDAQNEAFARLVATERFGDDATWARLAGAEDFSSSSCGPRALFFLARIAGKAVSLADLTAGLPRAEVERGNSSLASLQAASESLGLESRAEHVPFERTDELTEWTLVHLATPGGDAPGHFSALKYSSDLEQFQVVDPPDTESYLTAEQLAPSWTGNLLRFGPRTPSAGRWRWPALLLAAFVLVSAVVLRRRT